MIAHLDSVPRTLPLKREQLADEQLMRRAQQGDSEAFGVLYNRHHAAITAYLHRLLGGRDDYEAVAQDVFLRAYRFARTYRYPHKFSAWLYTIARNLATNTLCERRSCGTRPVTDLNASLDVLAGPQQRDTQDPVERQEIVAKLLRAVDKLPPHQKEVVVLGVFEDLSYGQIEQLTGIKSVTLRSHMFQALKRLERRLRPTCA